MKNNPRTLKMAANRVKQEPPDDDLSAILDNDIHLTSIDKEAEGLITQQIEEILPTEKLEDDNQGEDDEDENENIDDSNSHDVPKMKFPCRQCDFKAKYKKELNRHEARHAIKGWYYECGYCEYVTYTRQRLVEHESKHTNTRPFGCDKCDFSCRFRADLYKHQAKHSTVKKFQCPKCDFRTKWCRNIKHHLVKHSEDRPHSCHICGFCFKRIQDLKYHLYRHNDQKPIECELCDFRCKTNYELKCHSLKHSNIKHFACTFTGCMQRTKTKSDLTKHLKTHNKANNYLCAICGKGFNTLQSLNKHRDRHITVRKFKCGLCDKWFKTKPSLRAHMKIHTGVKPFQCEICLNRYNNKYNMEKHKETHSGDRPFVCPICPYGAKVSEHLLAHIGSVHGDSHAYCCELCHKPFKRYSQLQVHIKRMHKNIRFSDRSSDGRINIKLEADEDGTIFTGNEAFSVKRLDQCNFEPEVKRKRGRPPKNRNKLPQKEPSVLDPDSQGTNFDQLQNCKPIIVKEEPTTPFKLATYENGIRLPLASKGFQFNFEKTGKKPRSWFMQPENMYGRAAVRQRAYMEKKERLYDKLHSGSVPRVRKKINVVFCLPSKFADEAAVLEDMSVPEPHKLIITGRHSLKTMRKMRRRMRKECLEDGSLDETKLPPHETNEDGSLDESKLPPHETKEDMLSNDVDESRSEDEDNLPLCQLTGKTKIVDSHSNDARQDLGVGSEVLNFGLQSPELQRSNAASSSGISSHIKMVLKRKRKGKFKVTMNISEVPIVHEDQMVKSKSDVYKGSVRILGKSLRDRKKINISAIEMQCAKEFTKPATRKGKPKKNASKENIKQSKKVTKNTNAKESKNKLKKAGKKSKRTANSKLKSIVKSMKRVNGGKKSKHNRKKCPKSAKGKKRKLVCLLGSVKKSKSAQNQNAMPNQNPTIHVMMPQQCEEFPIKLEPPDDDDYHSSIGWKPTENAGMVIKQEDTGEIPADYLQSAHSTSTTGVQVDIGHSTSEGSAPFKYLYDVKQDDTMAETNYTDHAIAWGLKEEVDVKPQKHNSQNCVDNDDDIYIGMLVDECCEDVSEYSEALKPSALKDRETSITSVPVNETPLESTRWKFGSGHQVHLVNGSCSQNHDLSSRIIHSWPENYSQVLHTRNNFNNCSPTSKCNSLSQSCNMTFEKKPDIGELMMECKAWNPCTARDVKERIQDGETCRDEVSQTPLVSYTYMF